MRESEWLNGALMKMKWSPQSGKERSSPARFGRYGFRRNFPFGGTYRGRAYAFKQVEVYAVEEEGVWHVITVLVKYF